MTLPVPNLDNRRFQELVDESKRMVQKKCPKWSDHNVHDPGVTLMELFAYMTEQIIYRLNRVPNNLYVKFLELIGVELFPPTAARAPVTFWLAAPQPDTVRIAADTQVATTRTETEDAISFATIDDLHIVPCEFILLASSPINEERRQLPVRQQPRASFQCFSRVPQTHDSLIIGLSEAIPSCALTLRLHCPPLGSGVDPNNPPLTWEAWDGQGWLPCDKEFDDTGGLNKDGDVVVHIPRSHRATFPASLGLEGERPLGYVRARITGPKPDQPRYSRSPVITQISAFTCGGTVDAVNAEAVMNEKLGVSEQVPGQRFQVERRPVVLSNSLVLEVENDQKPGIDQWKRVDHFAASGPQDPHFTFDAVTGEISLGPGVREPDDNFRQFGRVPAKDSELRLRLYHVGGGAAGNVEKGSLTVLKSSIPYVSRVVNRTAASGGADGESIDDAKVRGPIVLRTRGRAVTAEDYEYLAREAAPGEVARAHCVTASGEPDSEGGARVLIVPAARSRGGRIEFLDLIPSDDLVRRVHGRLEECRLVGARVLIAKPNYRGLTVVADLVARQGTETAPVEEAARQVLYTYLNPIIGGPDGIGWPLGRSVRSSEIHSQLERLRGVELIDDLKLYSADPVKKVRSNEPIPRLELGPRDLVFSFEHLVRVRTR